MSCVFELAVPFSPENLYEFYPRWLVCTPECCLPCTLNERQLVFEKTPPTSGFLVFLHKKYGLLKCDFSIEKFVVFLSQPRKAHRKERASLRLNDVENFLESSRLLNLSENGCLLQQDAELGEILFLHLNLPAQTLEVVAMCVHNTNEKSGLSFQAWKFVNEPKYRLSFGQAIPPLTRELQQISARRGRISTLTNKNSKTEQKEKPALPLSDKNPDFSRPMILRNDSQGPGNRPSNNWRVTNSMDNLSDSFFIQIEATPVSVLDVLIHMCEKDWVDRGALLTALLPVLHRTRNTLKNSEQK